MRPICGVSEAERYQVEPDPLPAPCSSLLVLLLGKACSFGESNGCIYGVMQSQYSAGKRANYSLRTFYRAKTELQPLTTTPTPAQPASLVQGTRAPQPHMLSSLMDHGKVRIGDEASR